MIRERSGFHKNMSHWGAQSEVVQRNLKPKKIGFFKTFFPEWYSINTLNSLQLEVNCLNLIEAPYAGLLIKVSRSSKGNRLQIFMNWWIGQAPFSRDRMPWQTHTVDQNWRWEITHDLSLTAIGVTLSSLFYLRESYLRSSISPRPPE